MESLKEIIQFLQIGARLDLKSVALQNILGTILKKCRLLLFLINKMFFFSDLTGNKDSLELILQSEDILNSLIVLLHDPNNVISKDSSLTLVNLSANEKGAEILINLIPKNDVPLMKSPDKLIKCCLNFISDQNSHLSDHCCAILSNLTRPSSLTDKIIDQILETEYSFDKLINIFTTIDYNKKGAKLHYLGPVFSNLSQSNRVRKYLLDEKKCVIQRLLPFTEYKESSIRRGGIVGTLRNCCFEDDYHKWLLSDSVDILPRLLLPLAGAEEFDDEDNEKLPIELQYLSEDKKREIDPDIR